jgi:hypothetical protein
MRVLVVGFLVLLSCARSAEAAPAPGTLVGVHVLSRIGVADRGVADASPKHALAQEGVTLYAAIEVAVGGGRTVVYSDAGVVQLAGGKKREARPLAEAGKLGLRWYRVEPTVEDMSNEASGKFAYETIPYEETEVPAWRDAGHVAADVRPTKTPDRGGGLGTMRFKVAVSLDGVTRVSAGVESRRGRGSGGLSDAVHRVSLRSGDDYLGWLTEMYGQPYIWASAGASDATHQSERLEGSDCADFVVYGWRRLGHAVPYTWSGGLPAYTNLRAAGARDERGVYVDAEGRAIAAPAPGEILLFPRHVGVFVRDGGVPGVLDDQDIMVHTLFHSPREQKIRESGYAGKPVEVRQWKDERTASKRR